MQLVFCELALELARKLQFLSGNKSVFFLFFSLLLIATRNYGFCESDREMLLD